MKRIQTAYLKYFWPMRHYLVTCGNAERANIIAVSFCMPVSKEPPMIACAIGQRMYSSELIQQTREFVVNVPAQELSRQIYYCGFRSGRDVDKFLETGLTALPARYVAAPIIGECVAHMECRVEQAVDSGDKILFIATVVDAYADEDVEQGRRTVEYAAGDFPKQVYGTRPRTVTDEKAQQDKSSVPGTPRR
jgi:flavin reductase (DIM6/NTAB) family NADH-FMN oxidoreductase RutF